MAEPLNLRDPGIPSDIPRHVFLLYGLSGFISLGYQVAWFRILVDWFGSTSLTFALVVSGFIGGLGTGALLSQTITRWLCRLTGIHDGLRLYGLIEVGVAVAALLTFASGYIPADIAGSFPFRDSDGIWIQSLPYGLVQLVTALACVFIPCFLMGVTFPLLCDTFHRNGASGDVHQVPSALYAGNTLGACTGVLACQFALIPWYGHGAVFWLMLGLNLLLGSFFLLRRGASPATSLAFGGNTTPLRKTASTWIAAAVLSGLLAGALEGDLFRRLGFILVLSPGATMSFVSFWVVLAIFLASIIVTRSPGLRFGHIKVAYLLAMLWYVALWSRADQLTYLLGDPTVPGAAHHFPVTLWQLFAYCGVYVLPVFLPVSLLLPFVCNRVQSAGHHLGVVYGVNTAAFCVGLMSFALIAPAVNIFFSLKLFLVFMAIVTAAVLALPAAGVVRAWIPAAFVTLIVIAIGATPRTFDPDFFTAEMWPHVRPPVEMRGNSAHTTYVLELPDRNLRLFFDRLSMSGTSLESQEYMRLMAHVPLLMHPDPQRALLICFGVGNTASAIAAHETIRQIDAVDLNADVFRMAPRFQAFHNNVQRDPRLRMINTDGRAFLRLTDSVYDLITSEPPPPLAGGVYRLYSREYYQQALTRLSPEGLMTQWLPVGQLPLAAADLAVRTFVEVFPHSLLFVGSGNHLILLGSPAPLNLQHLSSRFGESVPVRMDLASVGIFDAESLRARMLFDGDLLLDQLGPGRTLSDQHNDLEHLLYDPGDVGRSSFLP